MINTRLKGADITKLTKTARLETNVILLTGIRSLESQATRWIQSRYNQPWRVSNGRTAISRTSKDSKITTRGGNKCRATDHTTKMVDSTSQTTSCKTSRVLIRQTLRVNRETIIIRTRTQSSRLNLVKTLLSVSATNPWSILIDPFFLKCISYFVFYFRRSMQVWWQVYFHSWRCRSGSVRKPGWSGRTRQHANAKHANDDDK